MYTYIMMLIDCFENHTLELLRPAPGRQPASRMQDKGGMACPHTGVKPETMFNTSSPYSG